MAYVYPNIQHLASTTALLDLVGWLLNDETNTTTVSQFWTTGKGGTGGPGWTVIEAYGRNADLNPLRGIPATTTGDGTLASFETGSWINNAGTTGSGADGIRYPWSGAMAGGAEWQAGDWIVLQCNGTNPFQLYIEYETSGILSFKLIPLASKGNDDDFTLGIAGTVVTPPPGSDFPATSVPDGATASFRTMGTFAGTAQYSGTADDRMMSWLPDDGNTPSFIYIGDLEGSPPEDSYPYVIRNQNNRVAWHMDSSVFGDTVWDRLSPVDEITLLNEGVNELPWSGNANPSGFAGMIYDGYDPGANVSEQGLGPVGVWFNDTGHLHFAGWLKNVFISSDLYGASGSINDPTAIPGGDKVGPNSPGTRNYVFRFDLLPSAGGVALSWDGFTIYP